MKYILLLPILIFTSCIGSKHMKDQTPIQEISFGNGGGFTGAVTEYRITKDGVVYKNDIKIKEVEAEVIQGLLKKAHDIKDYRYNTPGNIYSFITITPGDSKVNKIVWGGLTDNNVSPEVKKLYTALEALVQ